MPERNLKILKNKEEKDRKFRSVSKDDKRKQHICLVIPLHTYLQHVGSIFTILIHMLMFNKLFKNLGTNENHLHHLITLAACKEEIYWG